MTKKFRRGFYLATVPAALLATPAGAQETGASSVGANDIVVTARKRQESILKVPVVVTALSGS